MIMTAIRCHLWADSGSWISRPSIPCSQDLAGQIPPYHLSLRVFTLSFSRTHAASISISGIPEPVFHLEHDKTSQGSAAECQPHFARSLDRTFSNDWSDS